MRKFLGILILISFFMTAFPRFSSAQYSQQQVTPQTSSQGEVLGISLETLLMKVTRHIAGGANNIFLWMIGSTMGPEGQEVLEENGLIGAILYGIFVQLLGLPNELFANATPPPGAIVMPPGDWYLSGGAIGTTSNYVASVLTTPSASGVYYAHTILDDVGIKTAYAQGGFFNDGFSVILNIWKVVRNLVFALLAVAFVIFGLMIMFRFKVSPQAVMTVEAALPRLIAVMLFITFSYAIAGFLYDLMFVINGVIVNIFQDGGVGGSYLFDDNMDKSRSVLDISKWGLFHEIEQVAWSIAYNNPLVPIVGVGIMAAITGLIAVLLTGGWALAAGMFFVLILAVSLLYVFIKTLIALIKTYVTIVMLIIFSPIYIFAGIFPGSPLGMGSWLRKLFANMMVFPAVTVLLILAAEFGKIGSGLDTMTFPHIGTGFGAVGTVLAFGAILYLPSVPSLVRNSLLDTKDGAGPASLLGVATAVSAPLLQRGVTASDAEWAETQKPQGPKADRRVKAKHDVVGMLRKFGYVK